MIPSHVRNNPIAHARYLDRLLIRRKSVQILEVLLFIARLVENSRYVLLRSFWRRCVLAVEEVLLQEETGLQIIDIGEIGLRDPRYNLVIIVPDNIPPPTRQ